MARADHVLLGWVNHADAGTVAASAIAGDLAASNLQNDIVGRRWRTTDLGAHVDVDFGGAREIGVLALVFPRDGALPLAASIRHQLDDGDGSAGDGGVHDSGVIALGLADGYGVHLYQPPQLLNLLLQTLDLQDQIRQGLLAQHPLQAAKAGIKGRGQVLSLQRAGQRQAGAEGNRGQPAGEAFACGYAGDLHSS